MWRLLFVAISGMVIVGLLLPEEAVAGFTGLPAGFEDQPFVDGLQNPTAIAWLPDDDLLIAEKEGDLLRTDPNGQGLAVLDTQIDVCDQGERGLLGVAVDPDFGTESGNIFIYYTANEDGNCFNRVSKFSLGPGNELGEEDILIDRIPSPATNHNGGDLQFGLDELLYVSVGDGNNGSLARRLDVVNGKILRIDRDGNIPAGNPFTGTGSQVCRATGDAAGQAQRVEAEKKSRKQKRRGRKRKRERRRDRGPVNACQEIFASGLRNPFRMAFDPDDNSGAQRFYINDVGEQTWEEIDAGQAGANYGWDAREGPCPIGQTRRCKRDPRFVQPVHAYRHSSGCRSITGGAFVPNTGTNWPDEFDDSYIYADFICNTLFRLRTTASGVSAEQFGENEKAVHLAFGPDGALYYTAFIDGEVRRISHPS